MESPVVLRRWVILVAALVTIAFTSFAFAQEPNDKTRLAADQLLLSGAQLATKGTPESRLSAIAKYEEALKLWRDLGDKKKQAEALNKIAEVYDSMNQPRKELEYLTQVAPLLHEVGDQQGEAQTLNDLGVLYGSFGENQKGIESLKQSLTLWRGLKEVIAEAVALHNLGSIYSSLRENQTALDHFNQALALLRGTNGKRQTATTLNSIGQIYESYGEYQKALDFYNQALAIRRELKLTGGEAASLTSIGLVYTRLGEYQQAQDNYQKALSLFQGIGIRGGEAITLHDIGFTYNRLGENERALDYYRRALAIFRDTSNRRREAQALQSIGQAVAAMGNKQQGLENLVQSLELSRAAGDRRGEAQTLHTIGSVYDSMGQQQQALDYYGRALALWRTIGDRNGEASTLLGVAHVERERGQLTEARKQITSALEIVEALRTKLAGQDRRASYLASNRTYYEFYVELLMRMHQERPGAGYDALALEISERARARSLIDDLVEAKADIRRGVDPALLERERTLQRQINDKERLRAQLLGGKHTEAQLAAAEGELNNFLNDYQEVQARIRLTSPHYAALTQPVPLGAKEIQQQVLDDNTLLLEYALGEERSFLWAVTRDSLQSFILPGRNEIEAAARRTYELLTVSSKRESQRPADIAANELSRILLGPLTGLLRKKRLMLVTEGALQYVPFASLTTPQARGSGRPLVLDHEIVNVPSASLLAVLRQDLKGRPPASENVVVFADAVFQSDDPRIKQGAVESKQTVVNNDLVRSAEQAGLMRFERLPYTRQEAQAVAAQAGEKKSLKALDFAASRATIFNERIDRYRVVHFATHGLLNSQHPQLSGIVLSLFDEQGRPIDGFLRAHETYNLKLNADLVVLSACRTALGKEIKGEGLVGLARGFMYAGAASVVASLWDVRDDATAELMGRFYEKMFKEKLRPAEALRAAQVSMLKEKRWEAPYYWAGFVLQGEWR